MLTLVAVVFFSAAAHSAIYDDFTAPYIDPEKWTVFGSGFTQPGDGYLHYSGVTPLKERLISKKVFPSGIFTMSFSDYFSDNAAPAGEGLGSVMAIGLGSTESGAWVRIERGQVLGTPEGQYIEANWRFRNSEGEWSKIYVNYVRSDTTSGFLRLMYDGTHVSFFYRTLETDDWTPMVITGQGGQPVLDENGETQPLVIMPGWTTTIPMFIDAIPGGDDGTDSYTMSFRVDFVSASNISIIDNLKALIIRIKNLASSDFKNTHQQNTLVNKLGAVLEKVEQGFYADAILKLQKDVLKKTDGCARKGEPDRNDWITNCGAQFEAYPLILEAIKGLQELI